MFYKINTNWNAIITNKIGLISFAIALIPFWNVIIAKLAALSCLQVASICFMPSLFLFYEKLIIINLPDFESVC